MKKSNTSERLKLYMQMYEMKQIDLFRKAKPVFDKYEMPFNRSYISLWISGRFEPDQKRLTALSEGLGVSETWLMGYDVPMERYAEIDYENAGEETRKQFDRIMSYYNKLMKLNEQDREMILSMIDRLESNG